MAEPLVLTPLVVASIGACGFDTLLLTSALDPALPSFELDAIAARMGVDVHGRHTALGDALVTAEIYVRLLPRLADLKVTTLGAALAYAQTAKGFVRKQREAGW